MQLIDASLTPLISGLNLLLSQDITDDLDQALAAAAAVPVAA